MGGDAGSAPTGGNTWETFTTKFNEHDLDGLKGMLDGANVQQVRDVAQNWQDLHDMLVGPGEGGGGIQKRFEDAVKKVLESWHGDSAEKFKEAAAKISTSFQNGAPFASHTAQVMGLTAQDLQKAVDKVKPIDDGWNWGDDVWGEMPWSDQIDDDDLNKVLKEGASTQGVLDANKDNLSGHQTKRLEAAVAMENLGTAYVVRSSGLKPPPPGVGIEHKHPDQPDPSNGNALGPVPTPVVPGGGVGGGGGALKVPTRGMKKSTPTPKMPETPKMPDQPGISGGVGSMKPHTPNVTTGLDGLQGGGGGGAGVKMPSAGGAGGGAGVHMPSGGGAGGGGLSGMPGMPGGGMPVRGAGGAKAGLGGAGGMKSGPGGAGGVKSGTGGAAGAGAGAKSGTGRPGMPGMGGAHGGAGKGAGGGRPGVSTGGAQARQKGGIIGSSGGKASGGAQGGSGLHRSRGGTAAGSGSSGGRRPAGMMGGAHGAHGGKGEGKGKDGNRPDYLVEDEETWTPERNVAPRVIE